MSDLTQLTLDSTLGHLPSHDFQVSSTTLGQVIAQKFGEQPDLPGVIITQDSQMLGMISRVKFREQMSLPDRVELYWQRPIRLLLDFIRIPPLVLSENWKIDEAVQTALNRPKDLVYEPIIVVLEDRSLHLLDIQTLILAQSQMLAQANKAIQQQKLEAKQYIEQIQQGQAKVKEYSQLIEATLKRKQKSSQSHSSEQTELLKQAQEIAQLNQRFIRIAQLICVEGKQAFQGTFQGSNFICNNTDKILNIGKAIAKDLEAVNSASKLIGEIIQQVRHLTVQATIVSNQQGNQSNGLSQVSLEISRLVSQAFEVGNQMDQITSRFKLRIQELTETAKGSANVARGVTQKIERAEMALLELEEFTRNQNPNLIPILQEHLRKVDTTTGDSLVQQIERSEAAVSELEKLVQQRDSRYLIEKIEQALRYRKKD
ncbi:chemotaxis protein [Kamptonema sp. UHCC 0994]|uniref:chemotaxis protein n=1 Tax=Kamptonema sp. UHCC 0994 TaxID=3031329 RepID=UPI0023B8D93D|nr:chemotaxis protein [Kamptonema sp. UHCC 0994]MDF0553937.1 chemotaxis protein [Kamptonema sp. UHCC 0994]